jgi:hypothetical protein
VNRCQTSVRFSSAVAAGSVQRQLVSGWRRGARRQLVGRSQIEGPRLFPVLVLVIPMTGGDPHRAGAPVSLIFRAVT